MDANQDMREALDQAANAGGDGMNTDQMPADGIEDDAVFIDPADVRI